MDKGVAHFQRGASFTSTLIGLIVVGIFFAVGFKLFSAYWDHATINSIVKTVSQDPDELSKSLRELRRDLDKKLYINQVELPEKDSLQIRLEEGVIYFDLVYEVRVPMFYNVDALVMFEEHYEAVKP
ncbi:DUF4845 domain-containing protein [Marinobacterium sediminicola]|uniref:DUF4845 domain-containing protein n=1 Tax=Marinobacterium sediminicola TaxID=518898 RepID=A0ABY1RZJ4_9GAMM|nr:DUF4845 domain-containing protein [Marinobacterium sediminicola]ULG69917.1 DUF4845 domain-containing protein [Marinobacterium sediminicola]SMR74366.1 protein of unknown function [Marinobacterium sediminicola]